MIVNFDVGAFDDLAHYFERFPDVSKESGSIAINQVIRRQGRKRFTDAIYSQINFPAGYLDLNGRFEVTKFAKPEDLQAVLTARYRATSLARFMSPGQSYNTAKMSGKVTVTVTPGKSHTFDRAFPIRLNAGDENTESIHNLGLAVRIPRGESLRGGKGLRLTKGSNNKTDLYLLYTVSVYQIFSRLIPLEEDNLANDVSQEFMRQFALRT